MFTETDPLYNFLNRADAGDLPVRHNPSQSDNFCHHYPVHHRRHYRDQFTEALLPHQKNRESAPRAGS